MSGYVNYYLRRIDAEYSLWKEGVYWKVGGFWTKALKLVRHRAFV